MGARGPLPKAYPANVTALKGDTGNLRPKSGVKARSGAPKMPSWLDSYGRSVWKAAVTELEPLGLLSPADRAPLVAYCEAAQLARRARLVLDAEGFTVEGSREQQVRHPAFDVWVKSVATMTTLGKQLGLSPEARLRMPTPPPDLDDSDLD